MNTGFSVIFDDNLLETELVEHDKHPFIKYGPEDLWWRIKYGFAEYRQVPSKRLFQVGNHWLMHPETYRKLQIHLERQRKMVADLMEIPKDIGLYGLAGNIYEHSNAR
jgi:hypothetical protein